MVRCADFQVCVVCHFAVDALVCKLRYLGPVWSCTVACDRHCKQRQFLQDPDCRGCAVCVDHNGTAPSRAALPAHHTAWQLLTSDDAKLALDRANGLAAVIQCLRICSNNPEVAQLCIELLALLAGDVATMKAIAEQATFSLLTCLRVHEDIPEMLHAVMKLLTDIALMDENIPSLLQHDAAQLVVNAMATHARDRELVLLCISVLDRMISAGKVCDRPARVR